MDDSVSCGSCGAHFQLDPSGDTAGAACSECGGKRFFRSQPSPTESDGTLRNMPDPDSDPYGRQDTGGFPFDEGTIVNDGISRGRGQFEPVHTKMASPVLYQIAELRKNLSPDIQREVDNILLHDGASTALQYLQQFAHPTKQIYPGTGYDMLTREAQFGSTTVSKAVEMRTLNMDPYPSLWGRVADITDPTTVPLSDQQNADVTPQAPAQPFYQIPQQEQAVPSMTPQQEQQWGNGQMTQNQHQYDTGQTPGQQSQQNLDTALGEGAVGLAGAGGLGAADLAAGGAAAADAGIAGGGGGLSSGIGTLMKGALIGDTAARDLGLTGGDGGGGGGSSQSQSPDQAPTLESLGSVDIPMLLLADLETPHSIKSVDEQHDDPEHQDQKEFNDGDDSPSNLKNPNNEDSGSDGEDGVRDATPGYGFGENSPALERAMMIMPLLLHYFESDESGENDPMVKSLHEALERENPGYMDQEHPDGPQTVQLLLHKHKGGPHHVGVQIGNPHSWSDPRSQGWAFRNPYHPMDPRYKTYESDLERIEGQEGEDPALEAPQGERVGGVNAMPGGMDATSGPAMGPGGSRICPRCGGVMTADGTCPNCGYRSTPQGSPQMDISDVEPDAYPPNRIMSTHQGPVTKEQQDALHQAIDTKPWLFSDVLDQIQNEPNTAPLVDPSQMTPPAPMPGMMNPPGAMPVNDPSQAGGGQPMQPMAGKTAETLPQSPEGWHNWDPYDMPDDVFGMNNCPKCHQKSMNMAGRCRNKNCGYTVGDEEGSGLGYLEADPTVPGTVPPGNYRQQLGDPHWGKTADANNLVPRCPHCNSATTTLISGADNDTENTKAHCHSCYKDFPISKSARVVLTEMPNPLLQNAAEQNEVRPEGGQDSSRTWMDAHGAPIEEGRTYELHAPGYDIPDQVQVVSKKPDELGLKLVGEFSNRGNGPDEPDFTIDPQQLALQKYQFVPSGQGNGDQVANEQPLGGMPGLDQIPQSGDTTDEASNSYPNKGTVSQVVAADYANREIAPMLVEEPDYDDLCHKCGGNWIDHVASSPTKTMHECARCGSVWETDDQFQGREAGVDLSYIMEDSQDDGFFSQMERARSMREAGGQARSLSDIASKDFRLQAVRDTLEHNRSERQQHVAGRHFTPSEQRALINEKGKARNADLLDLEGTHYEARYDSKANPYNVPEEHLLMGL